MVVCASSHSWGMLVAEICKKCDGKCGFLVMVHASPNPYVCQDADRESHHSTVVQEEGHYSLSKTQIGNHTIRLWFKRRGITHLARSSRAPILPSLIPLFHSLNSHFVFLLSK